MDNRRYKIKYTDESQFNKLITSLKKYNMSAYKKFVFKDLPNIRQGNLIGTNIEDNIYVIGYNTDPLFEFVHGKVKVIYKVNSDCVELIGVEPKKFLLEAFKILLDAYKGCPILCARDRFMIDFYNTQREDNNGR